MSCQREEIQFVSLAFCPGITNRNSFQMKTVKDKKCKGKICHYSRLTLMLYL